MFGRSTRTLTFLTGALLLGAGCSSGDVSPSATVSALATSESSTRVESSPTGQSSTTTTDPATGSSGNDRVTIADLLASAEVPARCDMPKQTLINGATDPSFSPRSGWLILDDGVGPIAADLNGDGNQELVVRFGCTAGGVGWPELLLVYTPGPRLLGYVDLAEFSQREHSYVTSWSPGSGAIGVVWQSYDGAGSGIEHIQGMLTADDDHVTLDVMSSRTPSDGAEAVGNAFTKALMEGDAAKARQLAAPEALAALGPDWESSQFSGASQCVVRDESFPMSCEITIVTGEPIEGDFAIIYRFDFTSDAEGQVKISAISNQGDAG